MNLELRPLPYDENALEPVVSARTVALHYHKHHAGYVHKLKELLGARLDAYASLETLIMECDRLRHDIFEQAAQIWNHDFFWESMRAPGLARASAPPDSLAALIARSFGSVDQLVRQFIARGESHFGSGWVWLAMDGDNLIVTTTANGRPLFTDGIYPLLACDLWEHAYYLDHEDRRREFLEQFCGTLLNWNFAASRLAWRDKEAASTAAARLPGAGGAGPAERIAGRT